MIHFTKCLLGILYVFCTLAMIRYPLRLYFEKEQKLLRWFFK